MSKIEVDAIDKQSGSTLTLGGSGTAVTLACGATQTGFGRTGTVDWQTGDIKTATFTAVNGQGFFANTTSGGFTANLPAGTAGAIVSFADYAGTWDTGALTVSPNGTDKIGGINADVVLNTLGQSVTFVFADSTQGWLNVQDSTSNERASAFLTATGGTVTCSGNDRIHTFTGPGTFCVTGTAACAANNVVSYLVIGGGGSGGNGGNYGGGGGAGGFRETKSPVTPYTASPLDGYPNAPNRITVTATAFPITVGAGGAGVGPGYCQGGQGNDGSVSTFSTISGAGGGGGGSGANPPGAIPPTSVAPGKNGGSGGGAGGMGPNTGGTGNTPPVTPAQGTNGGAAPAPGAGYSSAGGGGATAAGSSVTNPGSPGPTGGPGGAGATTSISATPTAYAGGGGGGGWNNPAGSGGTGGGGSGGANNGTPNATDGSTNTGGGGGGGSKSHPPSSPSGLGGSGIVIIRYKKQ